MSHSSYTLRPYQQAMSDAIVRHLTSSNDTPVIVQAATGAGKSLVIADVCHRLNAPVLILQPTAELLQQNYAKLLSYGVDDVSVYSASAGSKEIGKYTFATIGSIYKKPGLFAHFEHILVDECEVISPKAGIGMYQTFFNAIGCRNIVGLTATPYRMVQRWEWANGNLYSSAQLAVINRIGKFWKSIIFKIETQQLIDEGYLSPIKYRADTDDLHDLVVNSTGADYTSESLESWGNQKINRIADYIAWVNDKCQRNLVFCTSISQANKLHDKLEALGIASAVVTSETPTKARNDIVRHYKTGSITHLLNVGVFLAGFDVPELDCIIFARPTMSLRVWYQAVGRGVRLDPNNPDKLLRVFDLSGSLARFGRVETIHLEKEADGFRDLVMSETGKQTNKKLFSFKVKQRGEKKHERQSNSQTLLPGYQKVRTTRSQPHPR